VAALPQPEHSTVAAVYRSYEAREAASGGHRPHLGASLIGHACERALWLTFHWARRSSFDGRLLRLFNTGQRAEAHFVDDLRAAGIEVHDVDAFGQQFRVSAHGGHFGGSMDGAGQGFPEAPAAWHVLEFKTHNAKSFKALQDKGVQASKPMHFDQMQTYMGLTGMERAFYLAENKDTSELYSERVHFDPVAFARIMARAERVITAPEPAARIHTDPAWFECKWCNFHPLCHGQAVPEINCRTCAHSTARLDGDARWTCERRGHDVDLVAQRQACDDHRFIPILLQRLGEQTGATDEPTGNATVHYQCADGRTFSNGAAPAYSSQEIAACDPALLGDARINQVKARWPEARVVA
jgi:hypothetical protein